MKENFGHLDSPPAGPPRQIIRASIRGSERKEGSRKKFHVYDISVFLVGVAAHQPASPLAAFSFTRSAIPAHRAPPLPLSLATSLPAQLPMSLHGAPAQQSLSITARTTARRRHPTRTAERTSLATSDPATTHCVAAHHPRIHRARSRPGRHIILPAQLLLMSLHGAPVQRSLSITRAHNRQTPAMRRGLALAATPKQLFWSRFQGHVDSTAFSSLHFFSTPSPPSSDLARQLHSFSSHATAATVATQ